MSSACRGSIGAIPPFGGAFDVSRTRPCTSHSAIPPFGGGEVTVQGGEVTVQGGEVTVQGGVAPKVQTTSAKNADNGVSWAKWSALWAQRCPAWCVARTRTAEDAR